MLCAFFVVDARNYIFLLSRDIFHGIFDYIFFVAIQEPTSETDIRSLVYTCRQIRPMIREVCRARIPDRIIMKLRSNESEDMKMAVFWSFIHQIPSNAIYAGSFALWLIELFEDRRERNPVPYCIDVFLEQHTHTTIGVIDVDTNTEKMLRIANFAIVIGEFVTKIQDVFGYRMSSVHKEEPSIPQMVSVIEQYKEQQATTNNDLRVALPMLDLLDLVSIQDGTFYRYDINLPRIFPIARLSFKMKAYDDEHAVRSLVSTSDIDVCRIVFVHRKIHLELHTEEESKKNIRQYYDYYNR